MHIGLLEKVMNHVDDLHQNKIDQTSIEQIIEKRVESIMVLMMMIHLAL